ncbi:metallophosphoesterase family protein [Paenibacillus cymbidii]|uniref:metallophosphoesterase family protein n=1 Tax=Paenibacillus cymbidii TaxID=1639034 RepID=UPI0014367FD7|nr:metallophosphoesterase [Paenibacillus cymbidii]
MTDVLTIHWWTDLHLRDELTGKPEAEGAIWMERHYYAALDKLKMSVDIANAERPDLTVCTGDVIDRKQPLLAFAQMWDRVAGPKAFMLGNHDLDAGYDSVVRELGCEERPVTAGSRFTCSFPLYRGQTRARVLLLDTYVDAEGRHRYDTCEGTIGEAAFAWLESEMTICAETVVLLFAHNGIDGPEMYFDPRHAARFRELASRVVGSGKRLYHLAGHHHVYPLAVVRDVLPGYTFVNGVAMIAGSRSSVNVLTLDERGELAIDYRAVEYPYRPYRPHHPDRSDRASTYQN